MAVCANCEHSVQEHDERGCMRGLTTSEACVCIFEYHAMTRSFNLKNYPVTLRKPAEKPGDTQVGGSHYRETSLPPWDVVDAWGLGFYAGNALKYLYRAGRKGPKVEDLKKARHYIDKMIELEEKAGE